LTPMAFAGILAQALRPSETSRFSLRPLSIINVEGFEGRNVSFQCKHKIASNSNKYFCKDPCKDEGEKLVTVEPGRRAESGRIALMDSGDGSFTVTFSHLQLSDSQKYWCAVDRPGLDTYTEVQLAKECPASCRPQS
uniref:Immunoglobulin V-set domain-containing protein n=1 Tax=Maylandia zebra TaxID=106582 RepID=A0A3P9B775_9CICH